jgi:16S rRNA (uracil1498-N3)-methyltransferase
VAACEQCGGNRVPRIHPVRDLAEWLSTTGSQQDPLAGMVNCVLSLAPGAGTLSGVLNAEAPATSVTFLSGPEGGLNTSEDAVARAAGFRPVSLGPRTLRAESASLVALVMALAPAAANPA